MDVKSRHHLRADAIDAIETALADELAVELDAETYEKVTFEDSEWEVVLVDGEPAVFYVPEASGDDPDCPFLTVRGANEYPPGEHVVTVDAGAIEFVSNGADVMRPGITDADESIAAGDLVVISEAVHDKALAVGRARVDGTEMLGDEGKVVDTIHHVGDDLYAFSG